MILANIYLLFIPFSFDVLAFRKWKKKKYVSIKQLQNFRWIPPTTLTIALNQIQGHISRDFSSVCLCGYVSLAGKEAEGQDQTWCRDFTGSFRICAVTGHERISEGQWLFFFFQSASTLENRLQLAQKDLIREASEHKAAVLSIKNVTSVFLLNTIPADLLKQKFLSAWNCSFSWRTIIN